MHAMHPSSTLPRAAVLDLYPSKIREVANAGMGRADVLKFWFGEPDRPTAPAIREAARASLAAADTFYTHNLGNPELRSAIAGYLSGLHARPIEPARVAVTSSGVNALALAHQALAGPGARVVCVTPVWPNLTEAPKIQGAQVVRVALDFDSERGWTLDLDRLLDALTPDTATLVLNSPNNPTGWTITPEQQAAVLAHCRKLGIWIVADDVYERVYFGAPKAGGLVTAPSFLDLADAEDRLVSTNSFSKAWRMTGWRLGWICAPTAFVEELGKLIEYNTSCAPGFVQAAGLTAIRDSEADILADQARYRAARDHLCARLNALPGVHAPAAPGAMYAFFRVDGLTDSVAFCKRLVRDHGLGLAPGLAFGPEGEGFIRWCIAAEIATLDQGVDRLAQALAQART